MVCAAVGEGTLTPEASEFESATSAQESPQPTPTDQHRPETLMPRRGIKTGTEATTPGHEPWLCGIVTSALAWPTLGLREGEGPTQRLHWNFESQPSTDSPGATETKATRTGPRIEHSYARRGALWGEGAPYGSPPCPERRLCVSAPKRQTK